MAGKFLKAEFYELKLCECGRERCNPVKNIVSDVKDWHRLHYILFGKGVFILDGKAYELIKGSVFYIPPQKSAHYYPDKSDPWSYAWVGFDGAKAESILTQCGLSENNPIFSDRKKLTLKPYFNDLADRYNSYGELNMDCMSVAIKIFWEMTNYDNGVKKGLSQKESHVLEARQYIENNYQFSLTVQDIASGLGLSPNYLANIFKEVLKISPKQYLTSYRIDRACYLLIGSDDLIKDIGESVGYKNQLHFSAEFKRIKKISPMQYRKQNTINNSK